jgi:hypothetical protein
MQVISNMQARLNTVAHGIGEHHEATTKMALSLSRSLIQMMRLGGRITADGELSLYCRNDYIDYGVNFHSKKLVLVSPVDEIEYDLAGEWSVNS